MGSISPGARCRAGGAVERRPHPFHWIILVAVGLVYVLAVIGTLMGG